MVCIARSLLDCLVFKLQTKLHLRLCWWQAKVGFRRHCFLLSRVTFALCSFMPSDVWQYLLQAAFPFSPPLTSWNQHTSTYAASGSCNPGGPAMGPVEVCTIYLFIYLYISIFQSINLSIYLSLSVYLSIHPSIYLLHSYCNLHSMCKYKYKYIYIYILKNLDSRFQTLMAISVFTWQLRGRDNNVEHTSNIFKPCLSKCPLFMFRTSSDLTSTVFGDRLHVVNHVEPQCLDHDLKSWFPSPLPAMRGDTRPCTHGPSQHCSVWSPSTRRLGA